MIKVLRDRGGRMFNCWQSEVGVYEVRVDGTGVDVGSSPI